MRFLHMFAQFTWLQKSDLLDRGIPYHKQVEMYEEYGDYLTMGATEEDGRKLADEFLADWKRQYPKKEAVAATG